MTTQPQYGPLAAPYARRSQYLADALEALQQSSQQISSYGELGSRLLANALLQYGERRNNRNLREAQDQDFQNNPIVQSWRDLLAPQEQPRTPQVAPGLNDANGMVAALGAWPGTATRSTGGDPVPPPPAPPGLDDRTRDTMARLLIGEAATPEGRQAVANVIFNRANSAGMNPYDVMTQRHQFEPYGNQRTWQRLQGIDPNSPEYQQALQAIQAAQQQDITGGATHFYGPQTQAALGRPPPSWAQGPSRDIGGNRFYNLPYSAPPGYQAQQTSAPQSPPAQGAPPAMPPSSSGPAGGNAIPTISQAPPPRPQGAQAAGVGSITQQEIDYVNGLLSNPMTRQQGLQAAQELQQRAMAPRRLETQVTQSGQAIQTDQFGNIQTQQIPGYLPNLPAGMRYGQNGQAEPIPGTLSRTYRAEDLGIPAPPGTIISAAPDGRLTVVSRPTDGQQVTSGPGQPYREGAVPGGTRDPTSGQNLITGERSLREEYDREYRPFSEQRQAFERLGSVSRDATGASDVAIIFNYMKILDPGSTVREGEAATIQSTANVPDQIRNLYNQMIDPNAPRLSQAQRDNILNSARAQYQAAINRMEQANQRYGGLARSYGFDPSRIIQPLEIPRPQGQAQQQRGQPQQGQRPTGRARVVGIAP